MSESTFTQSASPTAGLTNYDVEPVAKELYPAPNVGARPRNRHAAWRKRFLSRGKMKKESTTMTNHTIEAMVGTLRKSVVTIADSNTSERDALLTKSFEEFSAALVGEVEDQLAKAAPAGEEPLYKGLGCIGRVANLVGNLASQIQTIIAGKESWQSDSTQADPASPELADHLEGLLAHSEAILRMAVNEHIVPMEDDDDGDGMQVVMVPMAKGGEIAVKTDLPEELAKYATDPESIDAMLADVGFAALESAGVDSDALNKALSGGALAKDAGMMGGAQATPDDASAAGADDVSADSENPLDVISRLAALIMIQVDHVNQMISGTNEPTDPTGEDDGTDPATAAAAANGTGSDAGGAGGATADPNDVNKNAPGGDLQKLANLDDETLEKALLAKGIDLNVLTKLADDNVALKSQVNEFETLTTELLAKAAPPKAPLVSSTVHKGGEDILAGGHAPVEQDLSKLSPQDRALAKMKQSHQTSGKPFRG